MIDGYDRTVLALACQLGCRDRDGRGDSSDSYGRADVSRKQPMKVRDPVSARPVSAAVLLSVGAAEWRGGEPCGWGSLVFVVKH